nr:hypothetical protein [uncultured Desulfobacter sp.]
MEILCFAAMPAKKYWRMPKVKWVDIAMPERYFIDKGLYLPGS